MTARPPREEVLALAAEVGQREASRRTGIPRGTIAEWAAAAKRSSADRPTTQPATPAAPAATGSRADEIRAQIKKFDGLTAAALGKDQMAAAVSAAAKATALRKELARLDCDVAAADLGPVERLEALRRAAVEDGSWVAAAQLGRQAAEERARAETHRANETLRLAAAAADATDVEHLRWVLSELTHLASTCTGIAKVQALREAGKVKLALDVAIEAAKGKGASTDEEVIAEIRAQLPDIPDLHLVEFVQEYCRRHNLPMPHRAIVGGRAAN